jgi:ribA/ribD-fused uncharacterized protein
MKYTIESIQREFNKGKNLKYLFFWGHQPSKDGNITKSCFSQWWFCKFEIEGQIYNCAEQYMMSEKAKLFGDYEIRERILQAKHPKQAKDLGRIVRGFKEDVWSENCFDIVKTGNLAKFSQNKELFEFLINTKQRILVEASPVDKIWGIGLAKDAIQIENTLTWKGKNLLGFALMEVRDELLNKRGV